MESHFDHEYNETSEASSVKFSKRKDRTSTKNLRKRIKEYDDDNATHGERAEYDLDEGKRTVLAEIEDSNDIDDFVSINGNVSKKSSSKSQKTAHPLINSNQKASKLDVAVTYDATGTALPLGLRDQGAAIHLAPSERDEVDTTKPTRGPVRAAANVRFSVRFDYQPDICKDYKETGYCGFGDSCIFLHDRGDYKSGWQLEREMEAAKKTNEESLSNNFVIEKDQEELPFACHICREEFRNPVVTKCKHYFCESCFLKHHKKSSKCALCGYQTMGIFSPARDLMARLEEKTKTSQDEKRMDATIIDRGRQSEYDGS
jgi:RING finger protein 113A